MSVSERTTTVCRALPEPLPTIRYQALEIASEGGTVCEEMEIRGKIDRESDAKLLETQQAIELTLRMWREDPQRAYRLLLIAKERLHEGRTLDDCEDDPCDRAAAAGEKVQKLSNTVVDLLAERAWPGGKTGA